MISTLPYLLLAFLTPRILLIRYILGIGSANYSSLASSSLTLLYGTPLVNLGLVATITPPLVLLALLLIIYMRATER